MADAGGQLDRWNDKITTFRKTGQGRVEVYDAPPTCMRLHLKEVPGTDIFIFVSNSQAKEAVAIQGMRVDGVSRIECLRSAGELCRSLDR